MKKFMDSIKSYEHVLGEDSVIDHFKNIVNKVIEIKNSIINHYTLLSCTFYLFILNV